MKVYTYKNCSTCRDAVKWLRGAAIAFEELPIRETPPSLAELRAMLAAHDGRSPSPLQHIRPRLQGPGIEGTNYRSCPQTRNSNCLVKMAI